MCEFILSELFRKLSVAVNCFMRCLDDGSFSAVLEKKHMPCLNSFLM